MPESTETYLTSELNRDEYLSSLAPIDRNRVIRFVEYMRLNKETFKGAAIGIMAFGSSTKPKEMRDHPVEDVDLLVLTSAPRDLAIVRLMKVKIRYFMDKLDTNHEEGYPYTSW